jgi:hypothetical protein
MGCPQYQADLGKVLKVPLIGYPILAIYVISKLANQMDWFLAILQALDDLIDIIDAAAPGAAADVLEGGPQAGILW